MSADPPLPAAADPLLSGEGKYRAIVAGMDEGFCLLERVPGDPADFRYLEGNRAFLAQAVRDDLIGRTMREAFGDELADVITRCDQVWRSGEPARFEHTMPQAGYTLDVHAARIAAAEGFQVALLFRDITERKRAEAALRDSEAQRSVALVSGRMGSWRWDLANDLITGDAQFHTLWGFPPTDAPQPLQRFADRMAPEGAAEMTALVARAAAAGEEFGGPLQITSGPTAGRWVRWQGRAAPGDPTILHGVTFDITEQQQAEARLRELEQRQAFLLKLSDTLRPLRAAAEIQQAATALLGEHLAVNRAGYYEVGPDQDEFFLTARWEHGTPPLPAQMRITDFGDEIRAGYLAGRTMAARDAAQEAVTAENLAAVQAIEVRAWIGVPLVKEGRWVAAMGVHSVVPRDWTAAELALVEEVAERTWAAAERARVEAALRASEVRFRLLFEGIDEGFCLCERVTDAPLDYRYLTANPAFERQSGLRDPVGRTMRELVPGVEESIMERYRQVEETGQPARFETHVAQLDSWFEIEATPADGPGRIAVLFRDISARRRAERTLRESEERQTFLLQLSDALRPLIDPGEIQRTAARFLGQQLGANRVFYVNVGPDEDTGTILDDYADGVPSRTGRYSLSAFSSAAVEDWQAGRIVATDDVQADGRYGQAERDAYASVSTRAGFGVPLIKDGRLVALFGVNQSTPRRWTDAEIELAQEVAERTWSTLERARVETALSERERQLALAVDIGAIGHWSYDLKSGELTSSAICRRNFGRAEDADFTYDDLVASIHPDDRKRQERAVAAAAESHAPLQLEYRLFTPAGELRWVEVRGQFVDGGKDRLVGVSQDITGRKTAEAALGEVQERQRLMNELVPALLWSASSDGRDISLNERWLAYTGQSAAEAGDYGWLDAIHPDDRPAAKAAFDHAFGSGEPLEREQRIHRAGNGYRWHLVRHVPVRDADGAITRWFGAAIDIHDMKLARQALDRSEAWLQTLMQGVPQLVWRAGAGGDWTWASPQWTAYTHQSEPDSHGQGWLDPVHPDDRAQVRELWAGADARGEFTADYRICHAEEGRHHWFQTRATPVRDQAGRIVEWLGTSTDVDDLRQLQDRQQLLVAELQHRVRNILTVVRSVFGRTVEAGGETEDIADHFRGRLDALARTQVVVTQSVTGAVDLENLIRDELLSVGAAGDSNVTVTGPDVLLPAKAAESIGLAIHELTTNAIKYGALRVAGGSLRIEWNVAADTANLFNRKQDRLTLTWTEQGVPALPLKPARRGFGSELIEEALPYRLGAETELEFRGGGVRCTISMPLPDPGALAADA